jgi:eukaryotic-like serine/threonine-protein kinase
MPLTPGTRLGPYEVLAPLGAGGMGEVYRAKDTRLDRTVAVKVLPSDLAADADRRARFEREGRAVSSLNHPHICTLHDIGRESGAQGAIDYLVMEYVDGENLGDKLLRGPLPLDQVLRYGAEIADALDKAHRHGIVHRDLKPGNVMLTRSGTKLLDFGLAKQGGVGGKSEPLSTLETKAKPLTTEGTLLGTFQYMAPEQLEGRDADARTDIFALGALLYEMATGKRAFVGRNQASLIAAIMSSEPPPISALRPTTPAALDWVIRTCLAKDPEERWQSAHDVVSQLTWIAQSASQAGRSGPSMPRRKSFGFLIFLIVAALIAALVIVAFQVHSPAQPQGAVRSSIVLPEKSALRAAVLSPDGTKMVCVARDASGRNLLWIRLLDSLVLQPLPGTDNPSFPFWSPDGRSIGFFADGKLKRIEAAGGPAQTLCDAPIGRGGSWGGDGVVLFAPTPDGPLYRVSASGGSATRATRKDPVRGETSHRWPFFLPDGKHFLYLVASFGSHAQQDKLGVYAASLDSTEETLLVRTNSSTAYAPGYLLFFRERNLLAQPFDAKSLRTTGDALPIAEDIQFFPQTFSALFSVSDNGLLLYQPRASSAVSQLTWFDRSGKAAGTVGAPGDQANPRISPDGKRVALDIADPQTGNMDVWIYEMAGGIGTRLTSDPAIDSDPVWSPDGRRVSFTSLRKGQPDLYQRSSNGAGNEEEILVSDRSKYPCDWSPDGRLMLYRAMDADSNMELWAVPVGADKTPIPFIKMTFGVTQGQFSPDGRWVAYASNESGKWEIYVAAFPGPGGNWRVSSAGGSEPRWRRDGKELFYLAPDAKLMAVEVKGGAVFEAGTARPLFQTHRREHIASTDMFSYDIGPDGRFLVNTDVGDAAPPSPTLVLNWPAALRR